MDCSLPRLKVDTAQCIVIQHTHITDDINHAGRRSTYKGVCEICAGNGRHAKHVPDKTIIHHLPNATQQSSNRNMRRCSRQLKLAWLGTFDNIMIYHTALTFDVRERLHRFKQDPAIPPTFSFLHRSRSLN